MMVEKKWRKKKFITSKLFSIDLSSLPKQFLKDDQQKKYPGKSDADAVQHNYPLIRYKTRRTSKDPPKSF